jgi:hypothetical protein
LPERSDCDRDRSAAELQRISHARQQRRQQKPSMITVRTESNRRLRDQSLVPIQVQWQWELPIAELALFQLSTLRSVGDEQALADDFRMHNPGRAKPRSIMDLHASAARVEITFRRAHRASSSARSIQGWIGDYISHAAHALSPQVRARHQKRAVPLRAQGLGRFL